MPAFPMAESSLEELSETWQQDEEETSTTATRPLNFLDAAHLHTVLHVTLEKLAVIGGMRVDPKVQADALTQSVGDEITRMIARQKQLEQLYEDKVSEQHQLRNKPNKHKLVENQEEINRVAEELRHSIQQLCRNLKDNPNVAENMAKVSSERQSLQTLLTRCMEELEAKQKLPSLLEFVQREERRDVEIKNTIEREHRTTAAVKQLKIDLRDEKAKHEDELRTRRKALLALTEQLKEMKTETGERFQYREVEVHAANECETRLESAGLEQMEAEVKLLQQKIAIEESVHEAAATYLKKLQVAGREDAASWAARIDTDVAAKEHDIDVLKQEHQRDLIKLKDVKERYEAEVLLREQRDEAERLAKEREAEDMQHKESMARAAVHIQAVWRGHTARKAVAGAGKGKDKKGGKTKKKK